MERGLQLVRVDPEAPLPERHHTLREEVADWLDRFWIVACYLFQPKTRRQQAPLEVNLGDGSVRHLLRLLFENKNSAYARWLAEYQRRARERQSDGVIHASFRPPVPKTED